MVDNISETKSEKKQSKWIIHLMKVYNEERIKNPSIKLKQVMPLAKLTYNKDG